MDISVILPVANEAENLKALLPRLTALLDREHITHEIVVIDGNSTDGTRETAAALGARVVMERRRGYAGAMETGIAEARGDYLLTLDADQSHDPDFVTKMWRARTRADIVVASRYVLGGVAYSDFIRRSTSWFLNWMLRRFLSMPVSDISSGFRLYRRDVFTDLKLTSSNFEVQEEILVKAYASGFSVVEVPFTYFPRGAGRSHAKLFSFGWKIFRSSLSLWKIRNSLASADYDERAFYSKIPPQRYWQRRRHRIAVLWARGAGRVLDAGCGSSLIVQSINNVVGMDFNYAKLRYSAPLRNSAGQRFRLRAAVQRRFVRLRDQLAGHRTYSVRRIDFQRDVPGAAARRHDYPRHARLCDDRMADHRTDLRLPDAGRIQGRAHHALHARAASEILGRHGIEIEETAYVARSELILKCRKVERAALAGSDAAAPASTAA